MTEHPGGHANPRRVKAASHDKPDVPEQPRGSHTGHERRAPELPQSAGWRSRDIIRAAALGVGVLALAVGIWEASTVLFTVFLGILFGLAISSGVDQLSRLRIPRGIGALLVVLAAIGLFTLAGALMAPVLGEQGREIRSRLPEAMQQLQSWVGREGSTLRAFTGRFSAAPPPPASDTAGRHHGDSTHVVQSPSPSPATPAAPAAPAAPGGAGQTGQGLAGIAGYLFGFVGSTVEIVVYVLLALFIAIYIASEPDLYHRGLMHLFPHRARARAGDVLTQIAPVLRKWLVTQLIAMVTLAVVWAIALSVLKVKAALALAAIAGILEFVPTIGPTMAVVPALAMALLDSPAKALSVLIVYLGIQGLEANVLIPLLMKGRISLPPALTIVAQALMTLAFGFLGLMVAVPLLAAAMVPVKLLYVEDVVGDSVTPEEDGETG
jgi:predicted PurR-regulated permease PerM